ncbi:MAG: arsenite methyltransferase [Anaerolineae bacterium]|nr:arsenite methyltransferase [Anaerolineae bacterium]
MSDANTIHEAVRERYGSIARTLSADPDLALKPAACCGEVSTTSATPGECGCSANRLYDAGLLADLPPGVTNLSLGCGDPVTIAALNPGETVLDLGSGGGIDCFMAARQVGASGHVIGVDMTPEMLARANANKASLGMDNVEFRRGQIEALPVDNVSIDVVMSNCVINLSPDKPAVFREVFRVLKPGGRAAISDIVTEGEFNPEQRAQMDRWAECITGAIDVSAYTGMMQDAGFVDIQVVNKDETPESVVAQQAGMPLVYSARITARKPGAKMPAAH